MMSWTTWSWRWRESRRWPHAAGAPARGGQASLSDVMRQFGLLRLRVGCGEHLESEVTRRSRSSRRLVLGHLAEGHVSQDLLLLLLLVRGRPPWLAPNQPRIMVMCALRESMVSCVTRRCVLVCACASAWVCGHVRERRFRCQVVHRQLVSKPRKNA